ncbi:MAG TPA: FAD-linked oxidase C-terminal domain-containing protein [Candidatus Acidoferrales bacterium]|nr:FAD-linked oxidase C-terminal domain-containing protein [Candidatus Acidoferrales bacterium]
MSDFLGLLRAVVGERHLLTGDRLQDYSHDATFMDAPPLAAVLPAGTAEVAAVARLCNQSAVPLTARGAGSGLAGGPVPLAGGVVLSLERLKQLEIDTANVCAVAGAGVVTLDLQEAANQHGLMYPPDPASNTMSTIGGNVACNSGGMCCLKYGVTSDYVIGMTVVLADGRVLELGGRTRKRASGYRLAQLFIGSEGTLGIVTEVIMKLIPHPRHRATAMVGFGSIDDAAAAVSRLLQSGHFPAALELVDQGALELVAAHLPRGFRPQHEAVLIVETDGNDQEQVTQQLAEVVELLGGADNRVAQTAAERDGIWKARRQFGHVLLAMRHNFFAEDVAVPIARIPEMVRRFRRLSLETGIKIVTVGHAGDGNLHPTLIFSDEQRPLVGEVASRIFQDAVELGGTISAEHGLGALKRDHAELEHGAETIAVWRQLKQLFDPEGILNPHKVFPEKVADGRFLEGLPGWGVKLASGRERSELGA